MTKVEFMDGVGIHGKKTVIQNSPSTESEPAHMFAVWLTDESGQPTELWARSSSARRLSEVAFGCGAMVVRHDYDLVAEHERFHRG